MGRGPKQCESAARLQSRVRQSELVRTVAAMADTDEWWSDEGEPRDIFRRGDLVHRTPQPWTPAVADLLLYLESVGFDGSSRHRGYDDEAANF